MLVDLAFFRVDSDGEAKLAWSCLYHKTENLQVACRSHSLIVTRTPLQARTLAAANDALSAQLGSCSHGSEGATAGSPSDRGSRPVMPPISNGHSDRWSHGAAEEAASQGRPASDESHQRGARISQRQLTRLKQRIQ